MAIGFFLDGEVLYKKSKDQVLLRCVDAVEAKKIMHEIHEENHAGYYWMTLESDCIDYVRKCHKCQIYVDKIHVSPTSLNVMVSPWPFSMWGMDMIGPITPKASNGHRFIFVVIDYFTKWVEAASYASVTKSIVARIIKREIICRYGLPERIISDNGLNLNNDMVTEICTRFKVKYHNSVPYRPKMNGAVEAANKNVKKIIAKASADLEILEAQEEKKYETLFQ